MGAVADPVAVDALTSVPDPVFKVGHFTLDGLSARYRDVLHSRGPSAHFYAANGFPTACYKPLLACLSEHFSLTCLDNRALWPDARITPGLRCRDYADDLIAFVERRYTQPIIGMGHSMGATTTLMAAAKRPDLFRRLVLIEPVIQSTLGEFLTRWLPRTLLSRIEPIRGALAAPTHWPSRASAFVYYRAHRAFRRLDDRQLAGLVDGLTHPSGEGVSLVFGRDWEVHNYLTLDTVWRDLDLVQLPVRIIRGRPSMFLSSRAWQRLRQRLPQGEFLDAPDNGHLLPFEDPIGTAERVLQPPARQGDPGPKS